MRISKQVSGNARQRENQRRQGRGEFEICDEFNELRPPDLFNRRIFIELPGIGRIDTWTWLRHQGGKRRIRICPNSPEKAYPHRQVAVALMMPETSRSEPSMGDGAPVMRAEQYGIMHLFFTDIQLVDQDRVKVTIGDIEISNNYQQETISFGERLDAVKRVWLNVDKFDSAIAGLIREHEEMVRGGGPLGVPGEQLIRKLQREVATASIDYGIIGNSPVTDVLPSLIEIIENIVPEPKQDMEAIHPEMLDIRRREEKEWRRWAAARGAESAKFRREVRETYRSTCVVCGIHLPSLGSDTNPGVDAAHILPWADYDMDHITNGLCLCKLHHWAFDEGLIEIIFAGREYVISIPEGAEDRMHESHGFSIGFLRQNVGAIPTNRLPAEREKWPHPDLLRKLKEVRNP